MVTKHGWMSKKYSIWPLPMGIMGVGAVIGLIEGDEYCAAIGLLGVFVFLNAHVLTDIRTRLEQMEKALTRQKEGG